ncbi:hypothetical protein ACFWCD_26195, partial [Streptomyces goshikiensis]
MVLDGAHDPAPPRRRAVRPRRRAVRRPDAAVGRFLDWCAQHAAACGFRDGRPRQAFDALRRALDAGPVITASGRPAGHRLNAGKAIWPYLGQAMRAARARRDSPPPSAWAKRPRPAPARPGSPREADSPEAAADLAEVVRIYGIR